jgi:acetylglutamate kinase
MPEEKNILVLKVGGNLLDDETALEHLLDQFAPVPGKKILVHGGGKLATELSRQLNIVPQLVDGRRITSAASLRVVVMTYAGWVNKTIVAQLQTRGCNAVGICGADGNLLPAMRRKNSSIDYGFVGDPDVNDVNVPFLNALLSHSTPIIAPITHEDGTLLNTNADTVAATIAAALAKAGYAVRLLFGFEKNGVLFQPDNEQSVITFLTKADYELLKISGVVSKGMLPKLDNAFAAKAAGVHEVSIGPVLRLNDVLENQIPFTRILEHT